MVLQLLCTLIVNPLLYKSTELSNCLFEAGYMELSFNSIALVEGLYKNPAQLDNSLHLGAHSPAVP